MLHPPGPCLAGAPAEPGLTDLGALSRITHADCELPANTAVDWVTYADHVVQIRIDSERRLTATDEERANGEGLIGREVMVTTERTLWSRPGTANPPPARMVWDDGGWIFHGTPAIDTWSPSPTTPSPGPSASR